MAEQGQLFVHSRCCFEHWDLAYLGGNQFELVCSWCGKSIGPAFKVTGPDMSHAKCEACEQEKRGDNRE